VMTPKIARLIEAFHEPGTDIPAAFVAHDSELLGWGLDARATTAPK